MQGNLTEIESRLGRGKGELTPWLQLSPWFGWVPKIGPKLRSSKELLAVGQGLVSASRDLTVAANIAIPSGSRTSAQLLEGNRINGDALRSLAAGKSLFRSSVDHLSRVRVNLKRLEDRELPANLAQLVTTARQLTPDLENLARAGLTVSESWEVFLGYDAPKTYLVISQNADELRATGGFIPGAWLVTFDKGEITRLEFWDALEVDDLSASPLPPEGLLQSLWAGAWLFRDAAWYPDFPTSARAVEQIFRLGQGISVNGVIALNQWAVGGVLDAIGPITLPDQEQADGSTYMAVLERGTDGSGREYVDTVMEGFLDKLRGQGSGQELLGLIAALTKSLEQKEILLGFHDERLKDMVEKNGWDGSLKDTPGDFIMVVDSNVGFSKVNRNVAQRIEYQVTIAGDGAAEARLDILYTNNSLGGDPLSSCSIQAAGIIGISYADLKNACYWDYLRVYVPDGSSFELSTAFTMPEGALYGRIGYNDVEDTLRVYSENGKMVFAGFFTVEAGRSQRVAFKYSLPSGTVAREGGQLAYNLLLQKQSGKRDIPADVVVRMPEGYRLVRASPPPVSTDGNEARFAVISSGPHHQDSGEAKIRESTAGVSRKPSSDGKACGCSSKHLCGLTAWNT